MKKSNQSIKWYLIIVAIVCYGLGIAEMIFQTGVFYNILQKGFTLVPAVTALAVRGITKPANKKSSPKMDLTAD